MSCAVGSVLGRWKLLKPSCDEQGVHSSNRSREVRVKVPGGERVLLQLSLLPHEPLLVHVSGVTLEAFLVQILTVRETDEFPHRLDGLHDVCACILEMRYV